jgi:glycosyltransferase involved in cell wall biosynthesis
MGAGGEKADRALFPTGGNAMKSGSGARVVHLSSVHVPFDTRIFQKECRTLSADGYKVTLVVGHNRNEEIDGVSIRAVQKPKNRLDRFFRTIRAVRRVALDLDADLYHFHDPELIPLGLFLKRRGKKVIFDAHEDVPVQILGKHWIPKPLRRIPAAGAAAMEALAGRNLDGIVASSDIIGARFPPEKTAVVRNYPLISELEAQDALAYGERPFVFYFVGAIAEIRSAVEMVDAMALLPESLDARLLLAGRFSPPSLEEKLKKRPGWARVEFVGWHSRVQVRNALARCRAGITLCYPLRNYIEQQPTKIFECMAASVPMVASDFPVWREVIDGAGCGVAVDPQDPSSIAHAMQFILEHPEEAEEMGKRGRQAVLSKFNWESEAEALLALYRRVLNP